MIFGSKMPTLKHVTCGDVVYSPGGTLGPRLQQNVQFVVLHFGEMSIWIDGQRHNVPENHIQLLLPGHEETYRFARHENTHHSYVHLSFDLSNDVIERELANVHKLLPYSRDMERLLTFGLRLNHSTLPDTRPHLNLFGQQMLMLYWSESLTYQQDAFGQNANTILADACNYINQNLDTTLTLEGIAEQANVSVSHLNRLFNNVLYLSPMRYVWTQRTQHGIDLLKHTGLSIQEITYQCGFATTQHFAKRVKSTTGQTPTMIRNGA